VREDWPEDEREDESAAKPEVKLTAKRAVIHDAKRGAKLGAIWQAT
jgi:hypothetical protein